MSSFNPRGGGSDWRGSQSYTSSVRGGGYAPRGGRGRGGRGGWKSWTAKHTPQPEPDIIRHPLGELLHTFSLSDIKPEPERFAATAQITDLKYVSSYNWLDGKAPTIMVPGKPPAWTPLKTPQKLKEDNGQYLRDPNGARYSRYLSEPAVQAVLKSDSAFSASDIDVFACGSTLGNLLRFVRSSGKKFRFSAEVVGNTVFFIRKENDPQELIKDVKGYGHTFPEANTTWEKEVKGSESHQRLVQYNFGGLNCMLRFECDGYLKDSASNMGTTGDALHGNSNDDELLRSFDLASISNTLSSKNESLNIKPGGSAVPQNSIFDIKTRWAGKGEIDMSDILPVLWLKQIPNFIVAYHHNGSFEDIRVKDIRNDLQAWEEENKTAIERLAVLLHKIIDIAKSDNRGLLDVYCPSDRLEIRRQHGDGSYSLPQSLRAEWEGNLEEDASVPDSAKAFKEVISYDGYSYESDDEDEDEAKDFTACAAECGYCGRCSY